MDALNANGWETQLANNDFWENEKTRLVATWLLNDLDYCELARKFVMKNSDEPVIYRAWVKHQKLENFVTPQGICLSDPDLKFGILGDVLRTLIY